MVSDDFSSANNVLYHVLCTGLIIYLYDVTEFLGVTHTCSLKHVCAQAWCLTWLCDLHVVF